MSPTEVTEIRQALEARRDELLAKTKKEVHKGIAKTQVRNDVLGEGDNEKNAEDQAVVDALSQMRSNELQGIERALQRIAAGRYGICVDCVEEIEVKRLRALVFASRCRRCEEAEDRRRDQEAIERKLSRGMGLFAIS